MSEEDTDRIEGLEQLTRARAPSRDLWPGIEGRLRPRRSRYGLMQFTLAASLVVGVAAMFTLSLRDVGNGLPTYDVGRHSHAAALPLGDHSRAIVEANRSIVDDAERQLRQALKRDPNSTTLRALLASTETRQRALTAML